MRLNKFYLVELKKEQIDDGDPIDIAIMCWKVDKDGCYGVSGYSSHEHVNNYLPLFRRECEAHGLKSVLERIVKNKQLWATEEDIGHRYTYRVIVPLELLL